MKRNILKYVLSFGLVLFSGTSNLCASEIPEDLQEPFLKLGLETAKMHNKVQALQYLEFDRYEKQWLSSDVDSIINKKHAQKNLKTNLGISSPYTDDKSLKYNYLISRFAMERALDSLKSWILVDTTKYPDVMSLLKKDVQFGSSLSIPWEGKSKNSLRIYTAMQRNYPSLIDKIKNMQGIVDSSSSELNKMVMAESLIFPAVHLVRLKKAMLENDANRIKIEKLLIKPAKDFEQAYGIHKRPILEKIEKKLDEVAKIIGCNKYELKNRQTEEDIHSILSHQDLTSIEQAELRDSVKQITSGVACSEDKNEQESIKQTFDAVYSKEKGDSLSQKKLRVNIQFIEKLIASYLPKANTHLDAQRVRYEAVLTTLSKINERKAALHTSYMKLIYEEPYFSVLLRKVNIGGQEFQLYEKIYDDYKFYKNLGSEKNLKNIISYIVSALEKAQDQMIADTLRYMAMISSADGKALAPLVEIRQYVLSYIEENLPEQYDDWKEQDLQLTADYGFDIEYEKFAELTPVEIGWLIATSLATGQTKMLSKNAIKAVSSYQIFKEHKVRNLNRLAKIRSDILGKYPEAYSRVNKLDKYNISNTNNKSTLAKLDRALKKVDKMILKQVRKRAYGIGALKGAYSMWGLGLAIDGALVGYNYKKNKEYRNFSREFVGLASSIGVISYVSNIHASSYDDKDLYYTLAIQAATVVTFTNFTFLRGNGLAKVVNDVIRPKSGVGISALGSYMARSFNGALQSVAKLPLQATKSMVTAPKRMLNSFRNQFEGKFGKMFSHFFSEKIGRPLYNVWGSAMVAIGIDMSLRGYINPIEMIQEDEMAKINLVSFAIIDFILSYVSEGSSFTKASGVNFIAGVIGIAATQMIVQDSDVREYDFQRLMAEGAYIATYSTAKYKLLFKKFFIQAETKYVRLGMSKARQISGKLGLSVVNNFAGNLPFLFAVRHLETYEEEKGGKEKYFAEKFYKELIELNDSYMYLNLETISDMTLEIQNINEQLDARLASYEKEAS